ncbi:unnamed protein product [Mytilus edulis]|uniref:Uncharacterized protein n=1 Tax=Mytilus edulis TaxID=6550 RepID=A0A8S3RMH2_MYTED|nr:unnamed protein product [Mytilus edulis]
MKRGGFDSLIEALKISGNGHVADKILNTDVCCRKDKTQLQKEDSFFVFDDRKEEIIQLIKERELVKMRYTELSTKYKTIKSDNETKSDDIKILKEEIDSLRCQLAEVEKKASNIKDELKKRDKEIQKGKHVELRPKLFKDRKDVGIDAVDGPLEELPNDATHYNNLIATLEDQIQELKATVDEKNNDIMTLRNNVGKLQVHLKAGRQEREKISAELRKDMEKNMKIHDERFDQIDDKMEYVIKLLTINRNAPRQLEVNPIKSPRNQKQNKYTKKFGR